MRCPRLTFENNLVGLLRQITKNNILYKLRLKVYINCKFSEILICHTSVCYQRGLRRLVYLITKSKFTNKPIITILSQKAFTALVEQCSTVQSRTVKYSEVQGNLVQ